MEKGVRVTKRKARADDLSEAFRENYRDYQYRFVEFFVEHLTDVSRAFSGDLQQAMVLAILGQMRLRAVREAMARGEPLAAEMKGDGTTASRIADVTGIPRETVRRKLDALRRNGWVVQDEDRLWRIEIDPDGAGAAARRDLAGLDERALHRIARLVADLENFDGH